MFIKLCVHRHSISEIKTDCKLYNHLNSEALTKWSKQSQYLHIWEREALLTEATGLGLI